MADLVTLGAAKTFIGMDENCDDTQLKRLIGYASTAVETYLGRTIALTEYREWVDGSNSAYQRLDQWPITRLYQVTDGTQNLGRLTYTGTAIESFASCDGKVLTLVDTSANDLTLATYPTGTTLAAAVALLTGWTLTLYTADLATADTRKMRPFAAAANDGNSVDIEIPEDSIQGARVSQNSDWQIEGGFSGGHSNIFIWYKAGYSATPDGLVWAVLQIVRDAYYTSKPKRDITKDSEKLGDYSYKNAAGGSGAVSMTDIVGSYAKQLSPYMRIEWA